MIEWTNDIGLLIAVDPQFVGFHIDGVTVVAGPEQGVSRVPVDVVDQS